MGYLLFSPQFVFLTEEIIQYLFPSLFCRSLNSLPFFWIGSKIGDLLPY